MAAFDEHANAYDSWFMENENLLLSELKLVAHFLDKDSNILSIGCGSGLFEMLLTKDYDIHIKHGIEPSKDMAEIAEKRGLSVDINTAEEADIEPNTFDIIMFNGSVSYISDLALCINKAYAALKPGGKLILIDVPKESGFASLYNLASAVGTWDHQLLAQISPKDPYPIELVRSANWRTSDEKIELMQQAGLTDFEYAQTLLTHPMFANDKLQDVIEGYDRGDYVAICGYKKA
ncbi:class I SAM-dependent DNA methyltransferase [Psychrobacter sp. FDAARGOS_221]|uniref:class I SAM-dependent DNA methyltransferase n=1 Tax=Psychrobacter sp. FDAARGOS_221 TaxID=1975705 RepID=UPI000BB59426|nr:class I SAM-dependent methyltransferase [Psychrobacter sp. FDAARGOS_221]PNK60628.1 class I SAM-dependent methyltransferase [Psychrobacter sp. FDAARGOS_221]